ncbi:MAG: MFS transporter [candidate division KSB1 bacterium]|nr:MFS transporter [candidate division KSB1 bacterium]
MKKVLLTYQRAFSGLPAQVRHLSIALFINRAGSMVVMYLALYLTKQIGLTPAGAGKILSIYGMGSLAGTMLGGYLSDSIGPKQVQLFSLFSTAFLFVLLSIISNVYGIAVTAFFLAAAADAFRPANNAAAAQAAPPEIRARAFALNRLAINLGFAIGPTIGGLLARINYHYLFYIDGLSSALAGFYLAFFTPSYRSKTSRRAQSRSVHLDGILFGMLALLFFIGLVFFQLFSTWPLYLRNQIGLVENQIGVLMGLNGLMIALCELPLVLHLEKLHPLPIIAYGSLMICLGFALTPVFHSPLWLCFTVLLWTLGEMLTMSLSAAFIANRAPDERRGGAMGLYSFTFSLSMIFAPLIGGRIYEKYSSTALWAIIGLIGVGLFFCFHLLQVLLEAQVKSRGDGRHSL